MSDDTKTEIRRRIAEIDRVFNDGMLDETGIPEDSFSDITVRKAGSARGVLLPEHDIQLSSTHSAKIETITENGVQLSRLIGACNAASVRFWSQTGPIHLTPVVLTTRWTELPAMNQDVHQIEVLWFE